MITDSHMHLYPQDLNADPVAWAKAHGEGRWASLCTRRRKDGKFVQGFADIAGLLRAMDDAGISRGVLLGWYWERHETCVLQNRFYKECLAGHSDRLYACASFHPEGGRDAVLAEIRRVRDEGFIGLGELSPHAQGYGIDDPVFRDVLGLAAELKIPVNLHVTDPRSAAFPGRVETPLSDFTDLARAFPRTTFILAHWGGLLPLEEMPAKPFANVYYDTAASPLVYGPDIWSRFVVAVGAQRVLFGSDFPLNLYPKVALEAELVRFVAEANSSGLSKSELDLILHENSRRVFGL